MSRTTGRARATMRAALLLALLGPIGLAAQQDRAVEVRAGGQYAAGGLKQLLLGDDYRALWTAPITVPVLDLRRYAGGLTVEERGGGKQTRTLHLRGADGREYVFRSVDKFPEFADEPALRGTVVGALLQDQVSSMHPAAALVVAPLLEAAGVLHATPQLVVMPDDAALGEFRAEFGGLLGIVEERPDELEGDEDRPGFGGFTRIIGTDRLLERLEEGPDQQVDARAYATARLMDLLVGDWDRHYDQWRWGEAERGGVSFWIAIPRDRDYAFVDYDGLLLEAGRRLIANAVEFGPELSNVYGLTVNAQVLDRRLLAELELPVWDSIAAFLQSRLTDQVIDAAVARMPPAYAERNARELAAILRSRRDDLPQAAREFYRLLASDVDIRGTDERDLAIVDRVAEDEVVVRLFAEEADAPLLQREPYFERRFRAPETREVRIYLHGGDDRAIVRGDVRESLMVRVIGGGGDDVLVDSSTVRGDRFETAFYDARGENRFIRGRGTVVSTRPYEPPPAAHALSGQPYRDWGDNLAWSPFVSYQETDGLIVGAGPVYTRQGFRRVPYAYRVGGRVYAALGSWNVAADAFGDFRRTNSPRSYSVYARASQLENFRFFGFGNDTEPLGEDRLYEIEQDQIMARASANWALPRGLLQVGPIVKYTNPDVPEGSPIGELPRYGNDGFGQAGAWAEAVLDLRDSPRYPRRGVRLQAGGSAYPGVWSADSPFGSAFAEATGYLTTPVAVPLTLALRAGGIRAWGDFPVHEAAFVGGSRTLRGYPYQRFAGDAALYGSAELRVPIVTAALLLRGRLGALLLADAGRVYFEGESPGDWHTALGGGLWFGFRLRDADYAVSAVYAQGEEGRVYLKLGLPY